MSDNSDDFLSGVDEAIARNVKNARERWGWSQAELADKLSALGVPGMHQTTIARIESGQRSLRASEAIALGRLFDYRVEDLAESEKSSLLRAQLDSLSKATRAFYDAAENLFREKLLAAEAMDREIPYGSERDWIRVNPSVANLLDNLFSINSDPLSNVSASMKGWRDVIRDRVSPFEGSYTMELYDSLAWDGLGALPIDDKTEEPDDKFENEILSRFPEGGDDGERPEAP